MAKKVSAFLDTSALFAGVWSPAGGARMVLKQGEVDLIRLVVSSQVLSELERALRQKAPGSLPDQAVLLERSRASVCPTAEQEIFERCQSLVSRPGDARVVADAWSAGVDYLVTLDKEHLLDHPALASHLPFPVGTPGDFLAWLRSGLLDQIFSAG